MGKRRLQIVKQSPPLMLGICGRCNSQFKSNRPEPLDDIREQFHFHVCKPISSSQNALRIDREASDSK
ncbi:MAG TPA: hypothetical protein VND65_11280 [Candidatus Binatia bacterium]|nr:hypothetical protein [Candidatus Binatia bacterium]